MPEIMTYYVKDERTELTHAVITYNKNTKQFALYIKPEELPLTPLSILMFKTKGRYVVKGQDALEWVKMRIFPPNRDNVGQLLRANGLDRYDEFEIFRLSKGRCCIDHLYIEPI